MRLIDPAREQELIKLAERKRRQAEIQKFLRPTFETIGKLHTPKGKPKPKVYDAWSYPKRSIVYRMRGVKGCPDCGGNGDKWVDLSQPGGDAYGFIRCPTCSNRLVSAREKA